MLIPEFENIVKTDKIAERYFINLCWKNYQRFCPRCLNRKIYRFHLHKYRCKNCHYDFHDFTGRWINQVKISCRQWLWVIKLFELELSARKISQQLTISYPTVLKALTVIRLAILKNGQTGLLMNGEVEADEAYFGGRRKGKRGRGAANKTPVFGILERNGQVRVEAVKNVTAETLLSHTIKTVRRGSIVYTDKYKGYDSLMFCGYRHLQIDHQKQFARGKVYINGIEGFWSYAKERIMKYHGVSKEKFPLYLKEMEFRYNHRKDNIFNLIAIYLTNFVEKLL